ncbi:MAG TPA: NRDE family protein, partial [Planctomycetota bacterium]|nr:NRDE family protein [Planctomycetota bacterium]
MSTLVVIRAKRGPYRLCLAAARDEDPTRKAAPPGLHLVDGVRTIFPMDRLHGGSWIGCNEHGLVGAVTNWPCQQAGDSAQSRGLALLAALGARTIDEATDRVRGLCEREVVRPFGLFLARGDDCHWLRGGLGVEGCEQRELQDDVLVVANGVHPQSVEVDGLEAWWQDAAQLPDFDVESVLDRLVVFLVTGRARSRDAGLPPGVERGADGAWPLCRVTGQPQSTHATLVALPRADAPWRLRHAHGNPKV